jgi:hypothetical protein
MACLFDGRTNLGMVRFYAQETGERIQKILEEIAKEERDGGLGKDFGASAADALDKLF